MPIINTPAELGLALQQGDCLYMVQGDHAVRLTDVTLKMGVVDYSHLHDGSSASFHHSESVRDFLTGCTILADPTQDELDYHTREPVLASDVEMDLLEEAGELQ